MTDGAFGMQEIARDYSPRSCAIPRDLHNLETESRDIGYPVGIKSNDRTIAA